MTLGSRIITENLFALQCTANNWQEAVKLGCTLLEEKEYITADYYQGILNVVAEHGPYFVILPGIAMPHARPEAGALKTGCSLVILKEPVDFGHENNGPVSILFTMAAKSTEEINEGILIEIMELLDDDNVIERLRQVKNAEDLKSVFGKF
ncbi:PTS transporter subunit EIIA [Brenneria izadpanahii]|uniref:Ascorbate-specific PTS system EIIA component n=1 Tax=Brenneria izadpanahii TaxID=2722756 RepID=A0ABX7UUY4_9GAMM|nr:PTS sugar transporter subunit IIA [Brenneria izadpanahii]QTF09115.1 PTS transporter subunit EIIA [Brenneria izadpanahii]